MLLWHFGVILLPFDNGNKMTPKWHVKAFYFSLKIETLCKYFLSKNFHLHSDLQFTWLYLTLYMCNMLSPNNSWSKSPKVSPCNINVNKLICMYIIIIIKKQLCIRYTSSISSWKFTKWSPFGNNFSQKLSQSQLWTDAVGIKNISFILTTGINGINNY